MTSYPYIEFMHNWIGKKTQNDLVWVSWSRGSLGAKKMQMVFENIPRHIYIHRVDERLNTLIQGVSIWAYLMLIGMNGPWRSQEQSITRDAESIAQYFDDRDEINLMTPHNLGYEKKRLASGGGGGVVTKRTGALNWLISYKG